MKTHKLRNTLALTMGGAMIVGFLVLDTAAFAAGPQDAGTDGHWVSGRWGRDGATSTPMMYGRFARGSDDDKDADRPRWRVALFTGGTGEPIIGGKVTSVNGELLTITNKSNLTYTVNAASSTFTKGNATSTLADVDIGDQVLVQGMVNGTSITASSVHDQGTVPSGEVTSTVAQGKPGEYRGFFGSVFGFFRTLFGF